MRKTSIKLVVFQAKYDTILDGLAREVIMEYFLSFIYKQNAVMLALYATLFTWGVTALGAAMVFFFRKLSQTMYSTMLGFASGVMIAASFWSLLEPALELAHEGTLPAWLVAAVGFAAGGLFLLGADHIIPHMHFMSKDGESEGIKTKLRRSILLVLSVTLHNIPEGLAVGAAIAGAVASGNQAAILASLGVALGIGIQNFPEGAAVSIPLKNEGLSNWKAFLYGQASGIVEPIAGVVGAALVVAIQPLLPYALSFAAGAMIYVVVEELIPQSQTDDHHGTHLATMGCMMGFIVMMVLDVALG